MLNTFPACNRQAHAPRPSQSHALTRPTSFQPTSQIFALVQIWATVTRQSSRLSSPPPPPLILLQSRPDTWLDFQMGECSFYQDLLIKQLAYMSCHNTHILCSFTEQVTHAQQKNTIFLLFTLLSLLRLNVHGPHNRAVLWM